MSKEGIGIDDIVYTQITRVWSPGMAFNLRATAKQKRLFYQHMRRQNWMEKNGHRMRYFDPLAEHEITFLRRQNHTLKRLLWLDVSTSASPTGITIREMSA